MSYIVNDIEYETVISLPAHKRYEYFVKKVVDFEEIWGLWQEGWSLMADNEGSECFPVWPAERYAAACATNEWSNYEPRAISLTIWIERWLPGMIRDKLNVAIFPTLNKKGIMLKPERLQHDFEEEMQNYA